MPVSGYDPEDLDDMLESLLNTEEIERYLTDDQWRSYQRGDESLVELLDDDDIEQLLEERNEPVD